MKVVTSELVKQVTSASYTMASGTAELVCLLDEREDLAAKIPSGYLNATVGLIEEEVNGNTKSTKIIKCALSITEGVMTLSIPATTNEKLISNAITIKDIIIEGGEGYEQLRFDE